MPFVKRKTASKFRKAHRYLGIFLGIQFLMWTISGMYFSWTDIDEIHGDHFRKSHVHPASFTNLKGISEVIPQVQINSLQLKEVAGEPYYWVNEETLVHARSGNQKQEISREEAIKIADKNMLDTLEISGIERITSTGEHHEYRGGRLPAFVISYAGSENIKAYVSAVDGTFRSVRHRDWRWFDFLWMTHTMDYETRDDFNTTILRAFSLLGLITVLSGFVLWFISSPTMMKIFGKTGKKKRFQ
ncbi:PepSY domain-containing protein [Salinimicrobium sediminilitoris]|uniref:PepSY domain-containing protein n=1 Tax=Salinimicrobium sediminilitoris TaxID=2876715 RepID=UPI001E4AC003|nr:PepSY domain-containing protein [Salinimicrobium sediminilitoris]MCC8361331.1 PepSY domain-containing protein [Salinimicrobium sediminilitoris]